MCRPWTRGRGYLGVGWIVEIQHADFDRSCCVRDCVLSGGGWWESLAYRRRGVLTKSQRDKPIKLLTERSRTSRIHSTRPLDPSAYSRR